jgi:putative methyltransferase (TIGR04325 family)
MIEHIWEGIYSNFSEVPFKGGGFRSNKWVENSLRKIELIRAGAECEGFTPKVPGFRESLLPVLAAIVYSETGKLYILDYGGGLGFTFYHVCRALPNSYHFEYHIIEIKEICVEGSQYFKDNPHIFFHRTINEISLLPDIIHMGSSLQYIEYWHSCLKQLCKLNSRYFLFTDLMAGNIPTYASCQKYYDSGIPVWFFNVSEIIELMEEEGYSLIFKSAYISEYKGIEQECPQENFEEKFRLKHSSIALFKRCRGDQ